MKKRIVSLLLAGLMCLSVVFSLAACGDKDDAKETGKSTGTAKVTDTAPATETEPVTAAPETEDNAPDVNVNEAADKFMKEVPCGTHNWVHMQFGAAATLTQEALGDMVLEKMGMSSPRYKVNFNESMFDALATGYQGEGDGKQAGFYVKLTVTDTKTNETSDEIKPYFRIEKNLEAEAPSYTVCPDEQ